MRLFLCALAGVFLALPAAAQPISTARPSLIAAPPPADAADVGRIVPDPSARYGVLPNGLRYAVMPRDRPTGGLSVRLHIGVGSFEERDGELGAAHFVEHMAFNGTRKFPEDELERRFSAAGIGFGRDQNAWTTLEGTQYAADVAVANPAKLDLVFDWLADVAYGQTFEQAAVNRERGVVLAEHDRRLGPAQQIGDAREAWRSPELRGPGRKPIGTAASIRALTPAALTAFHRRWYRPDNAVVVVVGDFPLEQMEGRIRAAFGGWTAAGPPPARAARRTPNLRRGLDVMSQGRPSSATSVEACLPRPFTDEPDTPAARRRALARGLWQAILNERLARLTRPGDTPVLSAGAVVAGAYEEAEYACLIGNAARDDWRATLQLTVAELRRLQAHGVTDGEIKREGAAVRTQIVAAAASADNRTAPVMADLLAADLVAGDVFEHPSETLRWFDRSLAAIGKADVDAALAGDWPRGGGPLLGVVSAVAPDAAEVRAAWVAAQAGPAPAAPTEVADAAFAYDGFGPAGGVVARTVIADPGFLRLTFANGVVLNFRPLVGTGVGVGVSAVFGEGRREIAPADLNIARMGAAIFIQGGTRRQSAPDIRTALAARKFGAGFGINPWSFVLNGTTTADDLKVQLGVMAAYIAEPGFRPEFEGAYRAIIEQNFRDVAISPEGTANEALIKTLAPGSPDDLRDPAAYRRLTSRDFARVLTPALSRAPIELTIVGDVDEASAVRAVAETFGALPARARNDRRRADAWWFRFPEQRPETIRTTHKGDAGRAAVMAVFPLYVADPVRRREERAIDLLGQVFDSRLRRLVRERRGQSYAPSVGTDMPDHADQGRLTVLVETSPAEAERVAAEIREVAAELARGEGLTLADLDAERRPLLDRSASRMRTVQWWRQTLTGSSVNDQNLRDQLDWESTYRSLTPEEVQKAARDWLSQPPVVVISVPEGAPGSVTAPPAPSGRRS